MITPITATFPALNFPKEVDYPTQEDWAAFSAAAELNYGILSGAWSDKSEEFKEQTNNLALEIQEIGENAFNAISLNTIEDLATYTGTGLVMVKDINRGGTFVSKTAIETDPNTGSLYVVNDGTVFAKLGGGYWVRQYSGVVNIKWFGAKGDWNGTTGTDDTLSIKKAFLLDGVTILFPEGNYKILSKKSIGLIENISIIGRYATIISDDMSIDISDPDRYASFWIGDNVNILGLRFDSLLEVPVVSTSALTDWIRVCGSNVTVENCYFTRANNDCIQIGARGTVYEKLLPPSNIKIIGIECEHYGRIAISGTDAKDVIVTNNFIHNESPMSGATTNLMNGGIWFERDLITQTIQNIKVENNNINNTRIPVSISTTEDNDDCLINNNTIICDDLSGSGTGTNPRTFVFGRGNATVTGNTFKGRLFNSCVTWGNSGNIKSLGNSFEITETDEGIYSIYNLTNCDLSSFGNTYLFSYITPKTQRTVTATVNDGNTYSADVMDMYFAVNDRPSVFTETSGTYLKQGAIGSAIIFKHKLLATTPAVKTITTSGDIVPFTTDISYGINNVVGTITITTAGTYRIEYGMLVSFSGSAYAIFDLKVNGVIKSSPIIYSSATSQTINGNKILRLEAGDVITIVGKTNAGTANIFTGNGGYLNIEKIAGGLFV